MVLLSWLAARQLIRQSVSRASTIRMDRFQCKSVRSRHKRGSRLLHALLPVRRCLPSRCTLCNIYPRRPRVPGFVLRGITLSQPGSPLDAGYWPSAIDPNKCAACAVFVHHGAEVSTTQVRWEGKVLPAASCVGTQRYLRLCSLLYSSVQTAF